MLGGTLRTASPLRVRGAYAQSPGTTLDVTLTGDGTPALTVPRRVLLDRDSTLVVRLDDQRPPKPGTTIPVIDARVLRGRFSRITVDGHHAEPVFTARGLSVRLTRS